MRTLGAAEKSGPAKLRPASDERHRDETKPPCGERTDATANTRSAVVGSGNRSVKLGVFQVPAAADQEQPPSPEAASWFSERAYSVSAGGGPIRYWVTFSPPVTTASSQTR